MNLQVNNLRKQTSSVSNGAEAHLDLERQESAAHLDLNLIVSPDQSPIRQYYQQQQSFKQPTALDMISKRMEDDSDLARIKMNSRVPDLGEKFNLQTREDFLNFSIEKVWAEMEQIGRNKKQTTDLFQEF